MLLFSCCDIRCSTCFPVHLLTLSARGSPETSSQKANAARVLRRTDGAHVCLVCCFRWATTASEIDGGQVLPVMVHHTQSGRHGRAAHFGAHPSCGLPGTRCCCGCVWRGSALQHEEKFGNFTHLAQPLLFSFLLCASGQPGKTPTVPRRKGLDRSLQFCGTFGFVQPGFLARANSFCCP